MSRKNPGSQFAPARNVAFWACAMIRGGVTVVLLLLVAACSNVDRERVVVSAASSLTDVFVELAETYEFSHPDVDVVLNFAGSSLLREQLLSGAPVDVFASASMEIMGEIEDSGLIDGDPVEFAANELQIAVPPGNPAGITGLEDFGRGDVFMGLCERQVPCGVLAHEVLSSAGVVPTLATEEPNVRALLTKVATGELDGGIVYRTDVLDSSDVAGVDIPSELNRTATYPIAVILEGPNRDSGRSFVEFVLSDDGREVLARHGFGTP